MGVKLGTLDISAFKVGSGDCKVYLGTELIYSGNTPTPPTPTGDTWVVYHSGDTVPSGVTFGGVRISSETTIDDGACSFKLTQNNYQLDFGNDFICTNGECMSYPCIQYECVEWDEETGDCVREDCTDWDWGNCEDWQCIDYADGYTVWDTNSEVYEENQFTFVDGYWTYLGDMQWLLGGNVLQFDIELLVTNS